MATEERYVISGSVQNPTQTLISGSTIRLYNQTDNSYIGKTISSSSGSYEFDLGETGSVQVGSDDFHVTSEWEDGGTFYNSLSYPYITPVVVSKEIPYSVTTDGLIFNLDANDPNSYNGSGTTWNDLSGNNNNGTLNLTDLTFNSGTPSYFNSNGTTGDKVTLGNQNWFYNRSFSFDIWYRYVDATNGGMILSAGTSASTRNLLHVTNRADGSMVFAYYADDLETPTVLSNNTWYNAQGTYDIGTDTSKFYLDGVEIASGNAGPFQTSNTEYHIGQWGYSSNASITGDISIARGYMDKVLTQNEVTNNFEAVRNIFGK